MNSKPFFLVGLLLLILLMGCAGNDDDHAPPPANDDDLPVDDDDFIDPPPPECSKGFHFEHGDCVPDAPEIPPYWHTEGRRIFDEDGRQIILHGINLSNDVKRPPYTSWAGPEDYLKLQSWGFNVIRLLTGWAAIMPEEDVISETNLSDLDRRFDYAEVADQWIILDFHQDVYGEGFGGNGGPRWSCDPALYDAHEPQSPWYLNYASPQVRECYDRFWRTPELQDQFIAAAVTAAQRYADREKLIGFDLYNEPYWGSAEVIPDFERDYLQAFYIRMMDALDQATPDKLFFIEPTTFSQFGFGVGFDRFPQRFAGRVIFAPHYYHRGVHDYHNYDGNPEPMTAIVESYQTEADRLGVPWLLGEWGGFTDSIGFDLYLRQMFDLFEVGHISDTYYEYSPATGSFSPINNDLSEKEFVLDVLARVYPKATGGALIDYAYEETQQRFVMRYETRSWITEPTLLAIPQRAYPDGIAIESSDPEGEWSYEYDPEASEARIYHDPATVAHEIVVSPFK